MKALVALALLLGVLAPVATPATADTPNAAGEYFPLAPARLLDTRFGGGPLNSDTTFDLPVIGQKGVPPTGVLALAMNVTVDSPTGNGFLTVWPSGSGRPDVSTLNFLAGQVSPNLTVVGVGGNGAVSFVLSDGVGGRFTGQLIVDVVGYYANDQVTTPGSRLTSVTPQRILDTRFGTGGITGPVGAAGDIAVQVAGQFNDANGPVATLDAVVLNLTTTSATSATFATVYPDGQDRPDVSNTNVRAGKDKAVLVMVKVPASGRIHIYNALGSVQFVADVVGYYRGGADPNTSAGRVLPLDPPLRAVDTRRDSMRLGTGQAESWGFDEMSASPSIAGFCPCAGVVMNVTGTDATSPTYLTVYPSEPRPDASTVNYSPNEAVANLTVARFAPGVDADGKPVQSTVRFYNAGGFTNYLGDVTAIILAD